MAEINVKGIRELSFNTTHIYNLVYFITPYLLDNHFFLNVIFKKSSYKRHVKMSLIWTDNQGLFDEAENGEDGLWG